MNHSEQERTGVVRAWLEEGSSELSPRVRDAVLREFPRRRQDGAFVPWRMPIAAYATVAAAAAALVVVFLLASPRLLPGIMPGGVAPTESPPTAAPTPTPEAIDRSYRDVGYIGLPPPGAVPTDPERTDLVEIPWCTVDDPCPPYRGAVFVYADGRMIWNEYFGGRSTGWLEQRLTVEGIELVRALAIEQAHDGGVREGPEPEQFPDLLPARAWADQTVRPYVPNGFAACLFAGDGSGRDDAEATLTGKLAMLPPDVAVLLRDAAPVPSQEVYPHCLGLDTDASRELDAALRRSGFEQDPGRNRYLLEYHLDADGAGPGTMIISIWFEPILPDGTIPCSSCG